MSADLTRRPSESKLSLFQRRIRGLETLGALTAVAMANARNRAKFASDLLGRGSGLVRKVLLVAEGDFSFSSSLVKEFVRSNGI